MGKGLEQRNLASAIQSRISSISTRRYSWGGSTGFAIKLITEMYDVGLPKFPWTSLGLVGIAYTLLGWYLSAYHVVWLVGILVAIFTIAAACESNPIVELLLRLFGSQSLSIVVSLSLIFSFLVAFMAAEPEVATLLATPTITTLLAALDFQSAQVRQFESFIALAIVAIVGLGLGEGIDMILLPSMRY